VLARGSPAARRVARRQDNDQQAESDFREAIALAQRMSARSWELRAAVSLARLLHDRGRRKEAHDLLAPIYAGSPRGSIPSI
jgi:predicted ATPase